MQVGGGEDIIFLVEDQNEGFKNKEKWQYKHKKQLNLQQRRDGGLKKQTKHLGGGAGDGDGDGDGDDDWDGDGSLLLELLVYTHT